jgi:hypothetical protein
MESARLRRGAIVRSNWYGTKGKLAKIVGRDGVSGNYLIKFLEPPGRHPGTKARDRRGVYEYYYSLLDPVPFELDSILGLTEEEKDD